MKKETKFLSQEERVASEMAETISLVHEAAVGAEAKLFVVKHQQRVLSEGNVPLTKDEKNIIDNPEIVEPPE